MAYVLGGDISYYQDRNDTVTVPNFDKAVRHGWRFVIIRAIYGLSPDSDFKMNMGNAKGRLLRGSYGFLVWPQDPIQQADAYWNIIKDDPGELPVVADFETVPGVATPADCVDRLQKYAQRLELLTGKIPIIYSNPSFWKTYYPYRKDKSYDWSRHALWIANYGVSAPSVPVPWSTYTIWQYSAKGDGVDAGMESLDVDEDRFNGSEADLERFVGRPVIKPQVQDVTIPQASWEELKQTLSDLREIVAKLGTIIK
jgi:lysozyme